MSVVKILLLGGTGHAVALGDTLSEAFPKHVDITYSVSGITDNPRTPKGCTLVKGGFGGIEGLKRYLLKNNINSVINATHPFSQKMSANCFAATHDLSIPLLRTVREEWQPQKEDSWIVVGDLEEAARKINQLGNCIMLAVGTSPRKIDPFSRLKFIRFVVRTPVYPSGNLPLNNYTLLIDPAIDVDNEMMIMRKNRVKGLVCCNSGGASTAAKILAARNLGVPVVIMRQPPSITQQTAASSDDVMEWLWHHFPKLASVSSVPKAEALNSA